MALVCTFTLGLSILFVDVLLHHLHLLRIGKTIAIVRFDSFIFFLLIIKFALLFRGIQ